MNVILQLYWHIQIKKNHNNKLKINRIIYIINSILFFLIFIAIYQVGCFSNKAIVSYIQQLGTIKEIIISLTIVCAAFQCLCTLFLGIIMVMYLCGKSKYLSAITEGMLTDLSLVTTSTLLFCLPYGLYWTLYELV